MHHRHDLIARTVGLLERIRGSTSTKPGFIRRRTGQRLDPTRMDEHPMRPRGNEPNVLEIKKLTLHIGKKCIFRDASFAVHESEIMAMVGPSGSGKSCLLKSIVGLLREEMPRAFVLRYSGQISYQGCDLLTCNENDIQQIRRSIIYVSLHSTCFSMSLYDHLDSALRCWYPLVPSGEREDRILCTIGSIRALRFIEAHLHDSDRTLSAGQLQLLCVASALVLGPDFLLLDEPSANIDPAAALLIEEAIDEFRAKEPTGILIATHSVQHALRVSQWHLVH